jgi:hypothetical protein
MRGTLFDGYLQLTRLFLLVLISGRLQEDLQEQNMVVGAPPVMSEQQSHALMRQQLCCVAWLSHHLILR